MYTLNFILYHVIVTINNCSDLDLAAMKALGQVLNGLVLQPRGMTGDIFEQKSKLFQRYKLYIYPYIMFVYILGMYVVLWPK